MAGSMAGFSQNEGVVYVESEVDLSSAGAVVAVRGTNMTCTKTGTGTYSFVLKGTSCLKMYEILDRFADLNGSPTAAFFAKVTSITQGAVANAPDDITIVVTTLNNAATPAATDVTAACTLDLAFAYRSIRMGNPL